MTIFEEVVFENTEERNEEIQGEYISEIEQTDDSYFYDWSDDENEPMYRVYIEDPLPTTFSYIKKSCKDLGSVYKNEYNKLMKEQKEKERETLQEKEDERRNSSLVEENKDGVIIGHKDVVMKKYVPDKRATLFKFKRNKELSQQAVDRRHEFEAKRAELENMSSEQREELEKKKLFEKLLSLEEKKYIFQLEKDFYKSFISDFRREFKKNHMFFDENAYNDYTYALYKIEECKENINKLNIIINGKPEIEDKEKKQENVEKEELNWSEISKEDKKENVDNEYLNDMINLITRKNTNTNKKVEKKKVVKVKEEKKVEKIIVEKKQEIVVEKVEEKVKKNNRMCRFSLKAKCTKTCCDFAHTFEELVPDNCLMGAECLTKNTDCPYLHNETKEQLLIRLKYKTASVVEFKTGIVKDKKESVEHFWNKISTTLSANIPEKKISDNRKSKMCDNIMNGRECPYKQCNFAHTFEELNPSICKHDRECKFGNCLYMHSNETKEQYMSRQGLYIPTKMYKHTTLAGGIKRCVCKNRSCTFSPCNFAHSFEEFHPDICRNYMNCANKNCNFIHGFESKEDYVSRIGIRF